MNVIVVLIDSLNLNSLSPYGNNIVKTPNFERFSENTVIFENHFIGSAPCMPARRELMTGRKEFFWRGWGPIEPFDNHIAAEAKKAGAVTAIITDHYHYWEYPAHGYFEFFDSVRMIRGQELDMWNTDPCEKPPAWVEAINKGRPGWGDRYYKNIRDFSREEDYFSPKTMSEAVNWLDRNHAHDKFFLWVECFDVHEPFLVPEPYRSMYTDKLKEGYNCWPPYQEGYHGHNEDFWRNTSVDEIEFIRGQYYGKITMTDKWLGKLLDTLDKYCLWDNTAVIITTDHGHELGEKKRFGKQAPHYDLSAHIPLMIYHPLLKESFRTDTFTTAVDIYPTVLELLDGNKSLSPHGRSLMPIIRREAGINREALVYGEFGAGATITNSEYTYHCTWNKDAEINYYTSLMMRPSPDAISGKFMPGVDCPLWKIPAKSSDIIPELLFDRKSDYLQEYDISKSNYKEVRQMRELLRYIMAQEEVPLEQYRRLGLY